VAATCVQRYRPLGRSVKISQMVLGIECGGVVVIERPVALSSSTSLLDGSPAFGHEQLGFWGRASQGLDHGE
jgi:hypothetical protein